MDGPRRAPITVTFTRTFDPLEMARRGRLGARRLHELHDARAHTALARAAFMSRFEAEDDPEAAKRAYFARLGRLGAAARAAKGAAA